VAQVNLLVAHDIIVLVSRHESLVAQPIGCWIFKRTTKQRKKSGVFCQQLLAATPAWPYAMRHQPTVGSATPA
jgi:hypothetical protein